VAAGGRLYATDHSNEYISAPFGEYQTFHQVEGSDSPDLSSYDADANVSDPDLLAWLSAIDPEVIDDALGGLSRLPKIPTTRNYPAIDALHPVMATDDTGASVNVGHHAAVEGPCMACSDTTLVRPMAVTGQYGCGRMMFSTFETSSSSSGLVLPELPGFPWPLFPVDENANKLTPQELVLLHMILQIGECHLEPPPDVPIF
jgi:hypothetical protein